MDVKITLKEANAVFAQIIGFGLKVTNQPEVEMAQALSLPHADPQLFYKLLLPHFTWLILIIQVTELVSLDLCFLISSFSEVKALFLIRRPCSL